ncbi:hypothetical protein [Dyella sp. C11]|uniref:hypothetical protein n=1 Tax=Dyella sp. C11 TaxID=2126991 RepID=UPI000D65762F|nr:hypothetical protein [Dyella sp. C11]
MFSLFDFIVRYPWLVDAIEYTAAALAVFVVASFVLVVRRVRRMNREYFEQAQALRMRPSSANHDDELHAGPQFGQWQPGMHGHDSFHTGPAVNINGMPMIPGTSIDVTGKPYGFD